MWSDYLQKGEILEKAGLQSVDAHSAMENFGMYVSADIATSFTLLVGIFFPSATGQCLKANNRGLRAAFKLDRPQSTVAKNKNPFKFTTLITS